MGKRQCHRKPRSSEPLIQGVIVARTLSWGSVHDDNSGALQEKNLLVVAMDANREALQRDDPIVRRVIKILGQALIERNHRVTDESWFNRHQQLGRE